MRRPSRPSRRRRSPGSPGVPPRTTPRTGAGTAINGCGRLLKMFQPAAGERRRRGDQNQADRSPRERCAGRSPGSAHRRPPPPPNDTPTPTPPVNECTVITRMTISAPSASVPRSALNATPRRCPNNRRVPTMNATRLPLRRPCDRCRFCLPPRRAQRSRPACSFRPLPQSTARPRPHGSCAPAGAGERRGLSRAPSGARRRKRARTLIGPRERAPRPPSSRERSRRQLVAGRSA